MSTRAILWLLALMAPPLAAEHQSLWELGAGVTAIQLPDYRGSDQSRDYLLPYPFVIYRGERLRLDGSSAAERLIDAERFKLDLSVGGAPPVNSSENEARRDMPSLDPMGEIGLQGSWILSHDEAARRMWKFNLPMRAVVETDFKDTNHRGWISNPHLDLIQRLGGHPAWRLLISWGPIYADAEYHDHIYGVAADEVIPGEREAYTGRSGYGGHRTFITFSHYFGRNFLLGGFLRYDVVAGSVFEDSPLVRQGDALSAGVALTWILRRSEERARHVEF